jgi:hypothetical protein
MTELSSLYEQIPLCFSLSEFGKVVHYFVRFNPAARHSQMQKFGAVENTKLGQV